MRVKSPTFDEILPDNVFISGGNPHLISQFCNDQQASLKVCPTHFDYEF